MLVFEERGKLKYPEKNFSEQGRESWKLDFVRVSGNNKLNRHMTPSPRIERHWLEASVLFSAPSSLLPEEDQRNGQSV